MKKILFSLLMLCCMTAVWAEGSGDGTKEHPFAGEWTASELTAILKPGDRIANNCQIKDGHAINVYDAKLNNQRVGQYENWTPGDAIGESPASIYEQYCKYNTLEERRNQVFIVTEAHSHQLVSSQVYITGYFSGLYPDADGFVLIDSAEQLGKFLKGNDHAKVKLTDDIYMSDLGEGEAGRHTLCSTFYGDLDGDGHTIWAASPEVQHDGSGHYHRQYLFTYCDGATIKNVTFKDIRVQSEDNYNQAIITSQARNHCVFENITLDHVSVFGNKDKVGAVTGWTEDCIFKDILVKNSDFTTDGDLAGGVVGHAIRGNFTNIKVENCEATADNDMAGGVTGWADNCTFNNVDVRGGEIEAKDDYAGGVCGYAEGSKFISCLNSAKVLGDHYVGGILGYSTGTDITRGTNSGTINHRNFSEFYSYKDLGGIVGHAESGTIEQCTNSGEYPSLDDPCGGIVGYAENMTINNCHCAVAPIIHRAAWGGIVGACKSCKVTNTFSSEYHCFGVKEYCEDMDTESGNNFYFNFNTQDYKGLEYPECEKHAFDADGELAYIMNNSRENLAAGISPWEQEVGIVDPRLGDRGYYHTRKIKNPYGTLCFPFPVKSDDRISFYRLVEVKNDGDDIVLNFRYLPDVVSAGTPVLFYAPEVNDKASEESLVEVCFYNAGNDFTSEPYLPSFTRVWGLEGTLFETKVFDGENAERIYYLSDNQIHNAWKTTIYPFHAYIVGPSIHELTAEAKKITFSLEDEDGETTALELVGEDFVPVQNGKAYSIMGTEVNDSYRGIVIKNGKKYINR